MPPQTQIPPLLAPYTSFPFSSSVSSLTLLSSVLGATSNWLVLRYLCDALAAPTHSSSAGGARPEEAYGGVAVEDGEEREKKARRKVVLVSFMRQWDFWRAEARRVGLDLPRLANEGRFAFVDGLSELFAPVSPPTATGPKPAAQHSVLPHRTTPSPIPARAPAPVAAPQEGKPATGPVKKLHWSSRGGLDAVEKDILEVVQELKTAEGSRGTHADEESEVLLVIDQPDLLLASTGPGSGVGAAEMGEWLLGLREHVRGTVLTISADSPLIHNASPSAMLQQPSTPLEAEHAAFAVAVSHQAEMVIQLRCLDTGVARDVSGVLRASKGGGWSGDVLAADGAWGTETPEGWEKEVLYLVQGDGGVKVFGRGE